MRTSPANRQLNFRTIKLKQPPLTEEILPVTSVTTVSGVDVASYVDHSTIKSVTTLVGSYLNESFTIHTFDYNWAPWAIPYVYDGSFHVSGCVGMFNDDQGFIH